MWDNVYFYCYLLIKVYFLYINAEFMKIYKFDLVVYTSAKKIQKMKIFDHLYEQKNSN